MSAPTFTATPTPRTSVTGVTRRRPTRDVRAVLPHVVLGLVVVGALAYRWTLRDAVTSDYRMFLEPWYRHLAQSGLAGLADSFANYNTPYLALLALLTYVPAIPPLYAIKGLSVVFDLVLALFGFKIVRLLRPDPWSPVLASGLLLFLPTVVLNGADWAQCDSIYAAFGLASLYALLRRRPWAAAILFGVAFSFKLQAIFLAPALVALLIVNRHKLRTLLGVPAAFLAMLVPALIAGRSLLSQLAIYPGQMSDTSSGNVGARGGAVLTSNAPTIYAWLGSGDAVKYGGLAAAALVVLGFGVWVLRRPRPFTLRQALLVAATSSVVIPFLLPQMHERYFFVAEVLLVLAAFAEPWFAAPAVFVQAASTLTYLAYLRGSQVIPLAWSAGLAAVAVLTASALLVWRWTGTSTRPRDGAAPGS